MAVAEEVNGKMVSNEATEVVEGRVVLEDPDHVGSKM